MKLLQSNTMALAHIEMSLVIYDYCGCVCIYKGSGADICCSSK